MSSQKKRLQSSEHLPLPLTHADGAVTHLFPTVRPLPLMRRTQVSVPGHSHGVGLLSLSPLGVDSGVLVDELSDPHATRAIAQDTSRRAIDFGRMTRHRACSAPTA